MLLYELFAPRAKAKKFPGFSSTRGRSFATNSLSSCHFCELTVDQLIVLPRDLVGRRAQLTLSLPCIAPGDGQPWVGDRNDLLVML